MTTTKQISYNIHEHYQATSGYQVSLYLIPSAETDSGNIEIVEFGNVGPGTPMPAYHGRWYYLGDPGTSYVGESLLSKLQAQEVKFRAIDESYQGSEWNGNNHVGRWDLDALDAIESDPIDLECVQYWPAADWLSGDPRGVLSQLIADGDIAKAAAREVEIAEGDASLDIEEVAGELRHMAERRLEDIEDDEDATEEADALRAVLS